jgi:hypothetical protein
MCTLTSPLLKSYSQGHSIRRWSFGEWRLMSDISVLMKEVKCRPSDPFHHVRTQQEGAPMSREVPSPDTKTAHALILDF